MREALKPVRRLFGHTEAASFGPKALKTVRQHMIDQELSRGVINHRVSRIKRVFKWTVAEELVGLRGIAAPDLCQHVHALHHAAEGGVLAVEEAGGHEGSDNGALTCLACLTPPA